MIPSTNPIGGAKLNSVMPSLIQRLLTFVQSTTEAEVQKDTASLAFPNPTLAYSLDARPGSTGVPFKTAIMLPPAHNLIRVLMGLCSSVGFAAATVYFTLDGWHLHLSAKLGGTLPGLLFGLAYLFRPMCAWAAARRWSQ